MSVLNLKIYFNPGRNAKENCFCNAVNPQCDKGFNGECEVVRKQYDKFKGIEQCQANETRTYKKVHGSTRQTRN